MASQVLTDLIRTNPGLVLELLSFFKKLFSKSSDVKVVDAPRLPDDDDIPPPDVVKNKTRTIARLELKFKMIQYSKQLFPEEYTPDNPKGLVDNARERLIAAGQANMNRESKFWLDCTPYDTDNNPILEKDIQPGMQFAGLKFRPVFILTAGGGETRVEGTGNPDPQTAENSWIGAGITNYKSTNGFGCQFKCHGEGRVTAKVELVGLTSNVMEWNVS